MGHLIKLHILIFTIIFSLPAISREIIYGDDIERLNVVHGEETILRFPGQVKTISNVSDFDIAPVDKTDPDYSLLSIKPIFRESKGKVLFVLDNGSVLRVEFRTIKAGMPSKVDSFYEFISKKNVVRKTENLASISELELMKAMIRDDKVTGYKYRRLVRTVWNIGGNLKVQLVRLYTGKRFNGHVYRIENRSKKDAVRIRPELIFLGKPNQAIMSQVDDNTIYPKSDGKAVTYLRIVAKPNTIFSDIRLPYEKIKEVK